MMEIQQVGFIAFWGSTLLQSIKKNKGSLIFHCKMEHVTIDKWTFQMLCHRFFHFFWLLKVKIFGIIRISINHLVFTTSQFEQWIAVMRQSCYLCFSGVKSLIWRSCGFSALQLEFSSGILQPGKLIWTVIPVGGTLPFSTGKRTVIKAENIWCTNSDPQQ